MRRDIRRPCGRQADVPGHHHEPAALLGRARAASSCSPTTARWAPARSTPPPRCAALGPNAWRTCYVAAVPPSRRRPLRREPQPHAALLPVPGHLEALARSTRRSSTWARCKRHRHRSRRARRALRRGRLGKPDARRLGPWLGSVDGRHGGHAVHVLPAGGRHRVSSPSRSRSPTALSASTMYVQGVDYVYDLVLDRRLPDGTRITYGDVFHENECEFSTYNFEVADAELMLFSKFDEYEARVPAPASSASLPLPAYDCVMKCSHAFNILDARGAISATERSQLHPARPRRRQGLLRELSRRGRRQEETRIPRRARWPEWQIRRISCSRSDARRCPRSPLHQRVQAASQARREDARRGWFRRMAMFASSPRRAALPRSCPTWPDATEAVHEVIRGPKAQIAFDADGNPTKAAAGFAAQVRYRRLRARPRGGRGRQRVRLRRERTFPLSPQCRSCRCSATTSSPPSSGRTTAPSAGAPSTRPSCARFAGSARSLGAEVVPVTLRRRHERQHYRAAIASWRPGEHAVAEPAAYEQVAQGSPTCFAPRPARPLIREGIAAIEAERPGLPRGHARQRTLRRGREPLPSGPTVARGHLRRGVPPACPQEIICRRPCSSNQRYFPLFDARRAS